MWLLPKSGGVLSAQNGGSAVPQEERLAGRYWMNLSGAVDRIVVWRQDRNAIWRVSHRTPRHIGGKCVHVVGGSAVNCRLWSAPPSLNGFPWWQWGLPCSCGR